jgi:serine protease Do
MSKTITVLVCVLTLWASGAHGAGLTPAELFKKCAPSVVTVTAVETVPQGFANRTIDLLNPLPLLDTPGDALSFVLYPLFVLMNGPSKAGGSGTIISHDGLVLTNHHVIEDCDVFWVTLNDRRLIEAELIGSDAAEDYALLKLKLGKEETVTPAKLGDSSKLEPGAPVYAIGSPLGLRQTFSKGMVAAMHRRINGPFQDYIQTDLTIGAGSSGGALFNARGEVVGVTTLMFAVMEQTGGVTCSIPINSVKEGLDRLKKDKRVDRGHLGVLLRDCTPRLIKEHDLKRTVGACVEEVSFGPCPARQAGLQTGDVIVKYGDLIVKDARTLARTVLNTKPGTIVQIEFFRGNTYARRTIKIALR